LGAVVERFDEGLGAHHADDPLGPIDSCEIERGLVRQRPGPPFTGPARDICLALLGVDHRHREVQSFLAGDLPYQIDNELEVWLAAGAAASADQHWDALREAARSIKRRSRRIAIVEQKGLPEPR
jgi:hypothetical protein